MSCGIHGVWSDRCYLCNPAPPTTGSATPPAKEDLKEVVGKPQLSQLPRVPAIWAARVYEYGARKYARGNYLRRKPTREGDIARLGHYLDAVLRHLHAQTDALERSHSDGVGMITVAIDSESGLPHLAHALVSLQMLIAQLVDAGLAPEDPCAG